MLRYAHTISSASRRLASRHPMFCDPCTAGPRQFYPLRNNNLSGTKITVDILSDALNAGDGIHEYNLNGSSYTGNLPESNYAYGNGTVYRRNKTSITVVLYGGTQEPIATNYSSDGKTWRGWKVHALKSDLTDNLNHKKQILPWSTYRDGNYPISNFKFGFKFVHSCRGKF